MKISKEALKQIIKEELESEFGKSTVSSSERSKNLKTQAADIEAQKGIDNTERGIMQQFNQRLEKLAKISNIKSGSINSVLKKVYALMDKEIAKLEGGDQKDEE